MKIDKEIVTVKEMLEVLDEFAITYPSQAEALWGILTALRGPDNGDEIIKEHFTAKVRTTALPKTGIVANEGLYAMFALHPLTEAEAHVLVGKAKERSGHFFSHMTWAIESLIKQNMCEDEGTTTGPLAQG